MVIDMENGNGSVVVRRQDEGGEASSGDSPRYTVRSGRAGLGSAKLYSGVVVAIPAYNEEIAIGSIVAGCRKYVDSIVVVDDGSRDHTAELALLSGADVVSHLKNGGYGSAIRTCFEVGRARDAEILVILDGDGQHTPDDIPALVEEMKRSGADVAIGSRFLAMGKSRSKIPAYRKFGMKVLDQITLLGGNVKVTDSQSGFRAYSRKAVQAIRVRNTGMGAGSEILMEAVDLGLKIVEAPIHVRYDIKGTSSKNPVTHGLSVINSVISMTLQKKLA